MCFGRGAAEADTRGVEAEMEGATGGRMTRCKEPVVGCSGVWFWEHDGGVDGSITPG